MITPSFSLTATERVLPKLALDFTTASLDSRITFSRATSAVNPATYVGSSGLVTLASDNQPRFDYDPVTLAIKGLLIEESRQNFCKYSEDFSAVNWAFGASGAGVAPYIAATDIAAPNGTNTATAIVFNQGGTAAGDFSLMQQLSTAGFNIGTISVYLKVPSGTATIALREASGNVVKLCALTTSWQRFSVSDTVAVGNPYIQLICRGTYATTVTQFTCHVWGAQIEVGAFPTSYIPTTSTNLVRNADVATMTGTNFSDWWISTTGAAVARVIPSVVSGVRPAVQFDDNTTNNIIALRGNNTNPEAYIKATTDQAQIDAGTISANTLYGLGAVWNTDNCAAAVNGGATVPDTSATIPTVTQARLGSDGTNYLNGWLQSVRYWPQRITDAETSAFSKL